MNYLHYIELQDVSVKKGSSIILHRINLCINKNEFVGVIGPNGAGKSTLLNVIAGLERFEGTLKLFGEKESWRRDRKKRLKIGYLPQLFEIERRFPVNVLELVMTGVTGRIGLFRFPEKHHLYDAYDIMETLRIRHLAKKPVGILSGGERQKALLARTLMQKPDILLLDEPTANLDIAVQKEFFDLITEIHEKEKVTILLVTHDFNLLPQAMERAVLISQGKIVFDGHIWDTLSGERLSKIFNINLETFKGNGKRFISYDG